MNAKSRILSFCFFYFSLLSAHFVSASTIHAVQTGTNYYPISGFASALPQWSDPSTWAGGVVPGMNDDVIIPQEATVVIDMDIVVASITVNGQLVVHPDHDRVMYTGYLNVMGDEALFEWGTEDEPYSRYGVLTLKDDNAPSLTNYKAIMAANGGAVHIHGCYKESWTQLEGTAEVGVTDITVRGVTSGWKEGDEIAIASSAAYIWDKSNFGQDDDHLKESETRTIQNIYRQDNKTYISFAEPLQYFHYGELQTFTNGSRSWELDESAEVGLLTRCIKIQGDENSEDSRHGGHIMIMQDGFGYISGAELFRMGQESFKARYPYHWHMCGNVSGQYILNSSLHHLYNRAVTVHGSQNAIVNDNVVFETQGHAMFLEDAVETGVTFDHNLVMNVRRPPALSSFIGSDTGYEGDRVRGPGAFWITHPSNTFTNNHVAGVQGMGFWLGMPPSATGPSASSYSVTPDYEQLVEFDNNVAHGVMTGFHQDHKDDSGPNGVIASTHRTDNIGWQTVTNFTAYKCYRGWWTRTYPEGYIFDETILADCPGIGMTVSSFLGKTTNSLFVGHSANNPNGINYRTRAISLYDGYTNAYDCHFENFDQSDHAVFHDIGGRENKTNNLFTGCTFTNCEIFNPHQITAESSRLQSVSHDVDGLFTAPWGAFCMYHPFMVDDINFSQHGNIKCYKTDAHFAALRIYKDINAYLPNGAGYNGDVGLQYMEWDDGHCVHTDQRGHKKSQYPIVPGVGRIYKLRMLDGIPSNLDLHFLYAMNGDELDIQILDSPSLLSVNTTGYVGKSSEAQVWASTTNAYYWNSTSNTLSIRMIASGAGTTLEEKLTAEAEVNITGTGGAILARNPRPFGGTPRNVDTKIEAEWYDYGGQEVAYHKILPPEYLDYIHKYPDINNKPQNRDELQHGRLGEALRLYKSPSGMLALKDLDNSEYVNYTFIGPGTALPVTINYASVMQGSIDVLVDGISAWSNPQTLNSTGSATDFVTLTLPSIIIHKGTHVLTIKSLSDDLSFDWFSVGNANVVSPPAPVFKKGNNDIVDYTEPVPEVMVNLYPNPAENILEIDISNHTGFVKVNLYNSVGVWIRQYTINSSKKLDISEYPNGAYLLDFEGAGIRETRMFIKN